ncbi:hypothetical protein FRB99_008216 [Tulasnella sp. 403]|nr:hypothetical protein FRB99_008216 [Tulasnella sp. 403]
MQSKHTKRSPKKSFKKSAPHDQPANTAQHGFPLLSDNLPPEVLNRVTSFLLPHELINLAKTSKHFHAHVSLESTWRAAFLRFFLRLDPEAIPSYHEQFLLRRYEVTWKVEYIRRYQTLSRWEDSRSPAISHSPVRLECSPIRYIPGSSVLFTGSLARGVVVRSIPQTGKVLKGYLDAFRAVPTEGNPNIPQVGSEVTAIAITEWRKNVYAVWAYRNGVIAAASVSNGEEQFPSVASRRCSREDAHTSRVDHILCGQGNTFVTGGHDGRVKLWDLESVTTLWTSVPMVPPESNPCVKIAYNSLLQVVAAAFRNGNIIVWVLSVVEGSGTAQQLRQINLPSAIATPVTSAAVNITLDITISAIGIQLLLQEGQHPHLYRLTLPLQEDNIGDKTSEQTTPQVDRVMFCDGPLGDLTTLALNPTPLRVSIATSSPPCSVSSPTPVLPAGAMGPTAFKPGSILAAGDRLGRVSVWDWDEPGCLLPSGVVGVKSRGRFDAHDDGGVSIIQLSNIVWATGSTAGTVRVWNALTFQLLASLTPSLRRADPSPPSDPVSHLILDEVHHICIAAIGSQIFHWKADMRRRGPSLIGRRGGHLGSASQGSRAATRWLDKMEIKDAVRDSRATLQKEREQFVRTRNQRLSYQSTLDTLGLTEAEALEYAVMLSREEEMDASHQLEGVASTPSSSSLVTHRDVVDMPRTFPAIPQDRRGSPDSLVGEPGDGGASDLPANLPNGGPSSEVTDRSFSSDPSPSRRIKAHSRLKGSGFHPQSPSSASALPSAGEDDASDPWRINEDDTQTTFEEDLDFAIRLSLAEARSRETS